MTEAYKPLAEYGLIGNLETCALVGMDGSIDWCPLPTLESSSLFAAILDSEAGGHFSITPTESYEASQRYAERTNVLRTTFETASGTVRVTDFMPLLVEDTTEEPEVRALYRQVTCTEGSVELDIEYAPRFEYARAETVLDSVSAGLFGDGENEKVFLSTPADLSFAIDTNDARATRTIEADDTEWFCLQYGMQAPTDSDGCEEMLERTIEFWRDWTHDCDGTEADCPFGGYAHDFVVRAELVLKLLAYRDTGAIAAAPTTSLPEVIGGVRNWDYRYSWIRDGALTVRAFDNLGHEREARRYLNRFLDLSRSIDPAELRPLYGLEHSAEFEERELDSLEGYENSKPVRIGNAASSQMQLGMYGEMVNAIAHLAESEDGVAAQDWEAITEVIEYVRENWAEKGAGIWEQRGDPKHWVHSKMMCWVAIDRALELAEKENFDAPDEEWRETAAEIKETTIERGFDEELNAFTQSFRNEQMDASVLLGLLAGFPADDDHLTGTIDAVENRLMPDGPEEGLVYRYEDDGLPGDEGAFVICSFWLVGCLARAGRIERAREVFEAMQAYTSPLGLVAEELDPESGRLLGNYPQAFSHIGFVNSALYLAEAEHGESIEPFDGGSAE
jgi:GH15 family glucan-1,4-alpha-glucosidase